MDQPNPPPAPPPPDRTTAPRPSHRSRRRWWWLIVLIVAIVALLWWRMHPAGPPDTGHEAASGARGGGRGGRFQNAAQAQAVRVAKVTSGDMPVVLNALGTVTPLATVTVKSQISGFLTQVAFQEGQTVKKGDFLAQIDSRPYQIALENAQGILARDQALLNTARLDLKRYQTLLKQDSIASQQVDTQASLVQQDQGVVKSDQASVDSDKLNLIYSHVTAPVAGRLGLRQVDPGNYVTPGDATGLVVITQLDPISVIFTVPEDNLPQILQELHAGTIMSASAYDRSNTTLLATGALSTVDNQIDTTTGTVKLRASFSNPTDGLFPNQFVNIKLLVSALRSVAIIPTSAVQNGSPGAFVYVARNDNTVTVRKIQPGPVDGERTSVLSGLQVGEAVVIDGTDRLREGAKIIVPGPTAAGGATASGASVAARRHGAHGASGAAAASGASAAHRHRSRAAADPQ